MTIMIPLLTKEGIQGGYYNPTSVLPLVRGGKFSSGATPGVTLDEEM